MRWKILSFAIITTLVGVVWGTFVYPKFPPYSVHAQSPSSSDTRLARGVGVVTPSVVNFQGYLRDATTGSAVSNGTYSMRYCIYGSLTGGSAVWCETHSSIAISNGVFSVELGTKTRINSRILARPALYLGVKVGNDSELTPRTRLGSSFYSVSSQDSVTSNTTAFTSRQIALKQWYPFATAINPSFESSYEQDGSPIPISAIGFDGEGYLFRSAETISYENPVDGGGGSANNVGGCIDLVYIGAGRGPGMFCIRGTHVPSGGSDNLSGKVSLTGRSTYYDCQSCRRGAFDGEAVWVTQADTGKLRHYTFSATTTYGTILINLAGEYSVGTEPHGIAFDGDKLWVTDTANDAIVTIDPSDGSQLASYATGDEPTEIFYDGESVWVLNSADDTVLRLRGSDGENMGSFSTGINPTGIATDGSAIWIVSSGDATITRLSARDGELLSTTVVGMLGDADIQLNMKIVSDGRHMWVLHLKDDGPDLEGVTRKLPAVKRY